MGGACFATTGSDGPASNAAPETMDVSSGTVKDEGYSSRCSCSFFLSHALQGNTTVSTTLLSTIFSTVTCSRCQSALLTKALMPATPSVPMASDCSGPKSMLSSTKMSSWLRSNLSLCVDDLSSLRGPLLWATPKSWHVTVASVPDFLISDVLVVTRYATAAICVCSSPVEAPSSDPEGLSRNARSSAEPLVTMGVLSTSSAGSSPISNTSVADACCRTCAALANSRHGSILASCWLRASSVVTLARCCTTLTAFAAMAKTSRCDSSRVSAASWPNLLCQLAVCSLRSAALAEPSPSNLATTSLFPASTSNSAAHCRDILVGGAASSLPGRTKLSRKLASVPSGGVSDHSIDNREAPLPEFGFGLGSGVGVLPSGVTVCVRFPCHNAEGRGRVKTFDPFPDIASHSDVKRDPPAGVPGVLRPSLPSAVSSPELFVGNISSSLPELWCAVSAEFESCNPWLRFALPCWVPSILALTKLHKSECRRSIFVGLLSPPGFFF